MKRRELAKRLRKMERRVAALEQARMWEPLPSAEITGPDFDPHELLDRCVERWMHGYDDDEDWSNRGYL